MHSLLSIAELVARGLEVVGIAVIVLGALYATFIALRDWRRAEPGASLYHRFRRLLGRAILLGLEFLVAADIIGTVAIEPTLQSVAVLGAIVAIRTFLSFSLEVEISGRWPWQNPAPGEQPPRGES